jgi:hypothetical protein
MPAAHTADASAKDQSLGRKEYARRMRYVVIAMFVLILLSLASALVFVYRDESGSRRAVKALTVRVALSIGLFLLLMGAYWLGLIPGRL